MLSFRYPATMERRVLVRIVDSDELMPFVRSVSVLLRSLHIGEPPIGPPTFCIEPANEPVA